MDLIVHGGAGSAPDEPAKRQRVLDEAVTAGVAEQNPLDAVEVAIRVLEHDPRFNAGIGASVQADGVPRTDAGLMTEDRLIGSVASMPGVEHAVTAARVVMEETPHVQVAGVHAVDLAEAFDVPVAVDLWSDRTRERWEELDAPPHHPEVQLDWVTSNYGGGDGPAGPLDTVGAVARDGDEIAAATSTGGRWAALAGRVGDVPQVGSGFFATAAGGASATGSGEDIVRTTVAKDAVAAIEDGLEADAAADRAIDAFAEHAEGTAGVIVADAEGGLGSAFDSEAMQTASARR
ncbi:isoaspartyl peptidase/L-asparaginase [Salinarchaeum laminariae]|uniref:isoaspartyl peptidase/L-asparaginase n=1 Tax=Salinarchaeum laminariae TaxID=869888 RepID=UPI0020BE58E0|nr:isoaspartyl peptidase/L-asparaginase [Salinarchaeum laminariae]